MNASGVGIVQRAFSRSLLFAIRAGLRPQLRRQVVADSQGFRVATSFSKNGRKDSAVAGCGNAHSWEYRPCYNHVQPRSSRVSMHTRTDIDDGNLTSSSSPPPPHVFDHIRKTYCVNDRDVEEVLMLAASARFETPRDALPSLEKLDLGFGVILRGPAGAEIYQMELAKAVAREFNAAFVDDQDLDDELDLAATAAGAPDAPVAPDRPSSKAVRKRSRSTQMDEDDDDAMAQFFAMEPPDEPPPRLVDHEPRLRQLMSRLRGNCVLLIGGGFLTRCLQNSENAERLNTLLRALEARGERRFLVIGSLTEPVELGEADEEGPGEDEHAVVEEDFYLRIAVKKRRLTAYDKQLRALSRVCPVPVLVRPPTDAKELAQWNARLLHDMREYTAVINTRLIASAIRSAGHVPPSWHNPALLKVVEDVAGPHVLRTEDARRIASFAILDALHGHRSRRASPIGLTLEVRTTATAADSSGGSMSDVIAAGARTGVTSRFHPHSLSQRARLLHDQLRDAAEEVEGRRTVDSDLLRDVKGLLTLVASSPWRVEVPVIKYTNSGPPLPTAVSRRPAPTSPLSHAHELKSVADPKAPVVIDTPTMQRAIRLLHAMVQRPLTPAAGRQAGDEDRFRGLALDPAERQIVPNVVSPADLHVRFSDIGALDNVKQTLRELVMLPLRYPKLFERGNLKRTTKGILLFGPPGTGKSMLAKAVASESGATFININTSSLTSKWFGDSEKLGYAVFTLARKLQPSVVFLDEVDAVLGRRQSSDHEATRRLQNELMAAWDGFTSSEHERVIVMAASNRPFDLDEAVLRRLPKRLLVDVPDYEARLKILQILLKDEVLAPGFRVDQLAARLSGYTGSDLRQLCIAAAYGPVREFFQRHRATELLSTEPQDVPEQPLDGVHHSMLRPVAEDDFAIAQTKVRPSVVEDSTAVRELRQWNKDFGDLHARIRRVSMGFQAHNPTPL